MDEDGICICTSCGYQWKSPTKACKFCIKRTLNREERRTKIKVKSVKRKKYITNRFKGEEK